MPNGGGNFISAWPTQAQVLMVGGLWALQCANPTPSVCMAVGVLGLKQGCQWAPSPRHSPAGPMRNYVDRGV